MTERFAIEGAAGATTLFDGWQAGHYDLPDGLIAQGRALMALRAAARAAETRRDGLRGTPLTLKHQTALDALIGATATAGHLPDDPLADLLALAREAEEAEEAARLLREAANRAATFLEGGIIADHIIVGCLRPAFDATIDAVRRIAPDLSGADVTDTASVSAAGPKAARAFLALSDAAVRYSAIMAARHALRRFGGPGYADARGLFADTCAIPSGELVPTVGVKLRGAGPAETLPRLLWLATPEGHPYLPTLSEQDSRGERYSRYLATLAESAGGRRSAEHQRRIDRAYEAAAA